MPNVMSWRSTLYSEVNAYARLAWASCIWLLLGMRHQSTTRSKMSSRQPWLPLWHDHCNRALKPHVVESLRQSTAWTIAYCMYCTSHLVKAGCFRFAHIQYFVDDNVGAKVWLLSQPRSIVVIVVTTTLHTCVFSMYVIWYQHSVHSNMSAMPTCSNAW